jgi:hypothetical protein
MIVPPRCGAKVGHRQALIAKTPEESLGGHLSRQHAAGMSKSSAVCSLVSAGASLGWLRISRRGAGRSGTRWELILVGVSNIFAGAIGLWGSALPDRRLPTNQELASAFGRGCAASRRWGLTGATGDVQSPSSDEQRPTREHALRVGESPPRVGLTGW